jgi:hypothetical protein
MLESYNEKTLHLIARVHKFLLISKLKYFGEKHFPVKEI